MNTITALISDTLRDNPYFLDVAGPHISGE